MSTNEGVAPGKLQVKLLSSSGEVQPDEEQMNWPSAKEPVELGPNSYFSWFQGLAKRNRIEHHEVTCAQAQVGVLALGRSS